MSLAQLTAGRGTLGSRTQRSRTAGYPSAVSIRKVFPHDPYDRFSDHFRYAAQQVAKYRASRKRTDTAPMAESREAVEQTATMAEQLRTRGKAAQAHQGRVRDALARGEWQGALRLGVGDVRRLLPAPKGGAEQHEERRMTRGA